MARVQKILTLHDKWGNPMEVHADEVLSVEEIRADDMERALARITLISQDNNKRGVKFCVRESAAEITQLLKDAKARGNRGGE